MGSWGSGVVMVWCLIPTTGIEMGCTVSVFWDNSVGAVWCWDPEPSNSGSSKGLPGDQGCNGRGKLNLHFRDSNGLGIHPHLLNYLAYLLASNPGLSEGVFRYDKTSSAVVILGSSNTRLNQSIRRL